MGKNKTCYINGWLAEQRRVEETCPCPMCHETQQGLSKYING